MRYIFKILIFGNPESILNYITTHFGESGEVKETYTEYSQEFKVLDDTCDLDLDVITDPINVDYDSLLTISDGILYFLNPTNEDELELFLINIPVIRSIERRVPTVIIFYDEEGFIPLNSIDLLESIWTNYPEMEAFVNLSPFQFHQALQCLCLAMINGETPLNIENAWLRYPFFIKMANHYFQEKKYHEAANALKMVATIAEIYNMDELYITCEKSAYLFSLSDMYMEASKIIEGFEKRKADDYKKKHISSQIEKADELFNQKKYSEVANQYVNIGQLAALELMEKEIIHRCFKSAMKSWLLANEFEQAFSLLERLPHIVGIKILREVDGLIISTINSLISSNEFYLAKEQLEVALKIYQQEGLFENLQELVALYVELLLKVLKKEIEDENRYSSKAILDELEHYWSSFKTEKVNLDVLLEQFVNLAIRQKDFKLASVIINKVDSLELKRSLSDYSSKIEEEQEEVKKTVMEAKFKKAVEIIEESVEYENNLIQNLNKGVMKEAERYLKEKDFTNAYHHIKAHIDYLLKLDKAEVTNVLVQKLLSILIEGNLLSTFFKFYLEFYDKLNVELKKDLLIQYFPVIINTLKAQAESATYFRIENLYEEFNNILRDQSLYEESMELNIFFVNFLENRMLSILTKEDEINLIENLLPLLKKANYIVNNNLDPLMFDFNKMYERIASTYISKGELSSAQEYIDKIDQKEKQKELYKKLQEVEAESSKEMEASLKVQLLKEKSVTLRQEASDILKNKEIELKQRMAYKRVYFQQALHLVKDKKFEEALHLYKESIAKLNGIQKYNLAGVSLAIIALLYLKENQPELIKLSLDDAIQDQKLLSQTFPVKIVNLISQSFELKDENLRRDVLPLINNLPLFPEEINFYYDLMGWDQRTEIEGKKEENVIDFSSIINEIQELSCKMEMDKSEAAKRKLMKKKYWDEALNALEENNLDKASSSYINLIPELFERKLDRQASIALSLGIILLAQGKKVKTAEATLEKIGKSYSNKIESLPEYKLLKYFLLALKEDEFSIIKSTLETWLSNFYLFDPEKKVLSELLSNKIREEGAEGNKIKPLILPELKIKLDQMLAKLDLKMSSLKEDLSDLNKKRNIMKKRFYEKIILNLLGGSYEKVADEYRELAGIFLKRKDFTQGSLLIALYGLTLFKMNSSYVQIKKNIEDLLLNLGAIRQIVEDTFFVKLILFILELRINDLSTFDLKISQFLKALPLLKEEEILLKEFLDE